MIICVCVHRRCVLLFFLFSFYFLSVFSFFLSLVLSFFLSFFLSFLLACFLSFFLSFFLSVCLSFFLSFVFFSYLQGGAADTVRGVLLFCRPVLALRPSRYAGHRSPGPRRRKVDSCSPFRRAAAAAAAATNNNHHRRVCRINAP